MKAISRRTFTQATLGALTTYSLLETLCCDDLLAGEIKPVTAQWLAEVDQLGRDIKGAKVEQIQWHAKVEELLSQADVNDLLRFVDFEKLTKDVPLRDKGVRSLRPKFPEVEGLPTNLVYGRQIFAMKKGRSVVPHGHNNMATAFLIMKGEFAGRHYDRLEDEKDHLIIKPTIDRPFKPGEYSTVSDHKDNIHWFKATSDAGFIFNFHVLDVNPRPVYRTGRIYVDPAGEKLAGGKVRARRINAAEAHDLYG